MKRNKEPTWADLWLDALTAAWGTSLRRGAALERAGAVGGLRVRPGRIEAAVRDPAGGTFTSRLAVRPLRQDEWPALLTALLADPAVAAALDAGLLPPVIGPVSAAAGVLLLPPADDLAADCACGERMPCRHVAALVYAAAAAVAADPWLLPLLRGRDRAGFAQALAQARAALIPQPSSQLRAAGQDSPPFAGSGGEERRSSPPPAALQPPPFWELGPGLASLAIPIAAPPQPAPALRQLGPPPFWTPPTAFLPHLEPLYAAVTAAVLGIAAGAAGPADAESA